jgi:hypothetical protein
LESLWVRLFICVFWLISNFTLHSAQISEIETKSQETRGFALKSENGTKIESGCFKLTAFSPSTHFSSCFVSQNSDAIGSNRTFKVALKHQKIFGFVKSWRFRGNPGKFPVNSWKGPLSDSINLSKKVQQQKARAAVDDCIVEKLERSFERQLANPIQSYQNFCVNLNDASKNRKLKNWIQFRVDVVKIQESGSNHHQVFSFESADEFQSIMNSKVKDGDSKHLDECN